jgi:hypothetical protein
MRTIAIEYRWSEGHAFFYWNFHSSGIAVGE